MAPHTTDLHHEHHTLRQLLRTLKHPDGTPLSLAEETRATADLRRVRTLLRQLPGDPLAHRTMPRTRAEHAQRTGHRPTLDAALQAWALQEACPAWWLLEGHLTFNHAAYALLREMDWIGKDGLHTGTLTPHPHIAPLRRIAAYARQKVLTHRALPAHATPADTAPFQLLREVLMIRPNPANGLPEFHELRFTDPARPY
ncbi:hypothetical protein QOL99_01725 [Deinococcus sp. MIMF12]|uniref:Uncharacterized protein n=1 Tax=Deinococcus rhizophilus TaxID=3049544 RepID=A0ABT7JEF0_9DEIO|nr:hypothetical protein [Deinococcus rhizophilus]MDL2342860.1 hypothetical protein [Deinococcus rhizophilus]